jgi:RecJ-like exonuclease
MSKDAGCATKIVTESQACQKDTIGNEKMVSCLILRPQDMVRQEASENLDDQPECFKCDGKMVNKNGLPCKKCNGTGKINLKFFKDLQKILNNEVRAYCTQEYQKMMTAHLQSKREE